MKGKDELSLRIIFDHLKAKKTQLYIFLLASIALCLFYHFNFSKFVATGMIYFAPSSTGSPLSTVSISSSGPSLSGGRDIHFNRLFTIIQSNNFLVKFSKSVLAESPGKQLSDSLPGGRWGFFQTCENQSTCLAMKLSDAIDVVENGEPPNHNLEVRVTTLDPETSVIIANQLMEFARREITNQILKDIEQSKLYINDQLAEASLRMSDYENLVLQHKEGNKIISLSADEESYTASLVELDRQHKIVQVEMAKNKKIISSLKTELENTEKELINSGTSNSQNREVLDKLRLKINSLNRKKVLLESEGRLENSREISSLDERLEKYLLRLKILHNNFSKSGKRIFKSAGMGLPANVDYLTDKISNLRLETNELEAKNESIVQALKELKISKKDIPIIEQTLFDLTRRITLEFSLYEVLKRQIFNLELEIISLKNKFTVGETASIDWVKPRVSLLGKLVISVFVSFLLFLIVVLVGEELFPTVSSLRDLQELQLPVIGNIPKVKRPASPFNHDLEFPDVLAFQMLRNNIVSLAEKSKSPIKTIAVLSPAQNAGKSYVSMNLAKSMARAGLDTLLVDCDFRERQSTKTAGLESCSGFTDLMENSNFSKSESIHRIADALYVLPAGGQIPSSKAELISAVKVGRLLDSLRESFKFIILDTGPLLSVSDSLIIANQVDLALLVVACHQTRQIVLEKALDSLEKVRNSGVYGILNLDQSLPKAMYHYPEKKSLNLKNKINNFVSKKAG